MFKMNADTNLAQYTQAQGQLTSLDRSVYVASADIEKGTVVTTGETDKDGNVVSEANVTLTNISSSLPQDSYISDKDIGKRLAVDVKANEPIQKNMLMPSETTDSTRKYEISTVKLQNTQKVGDLVDVRITYADGEDFVVLSKKAIESMSESKDYFTININEDSILKYVSAMLDSILMPGTQLYTTTYVSEGQKASVETYSPRLETLGLLLKDDASGIQGDLNTEKGLTRDEYNLLTQARGQLEQYIATLPQEQLQAVSSALGTNASSTGVIGVDPATAANQTAPAQVYDEATGTYVTAPADGTAQTGTDAAAATGTDQTTAQTGTNTQNGTTANAGTTANTGAAATQNNAAQTSAASTAAAGTAAAKTLTGGNK